VLLPLRGFLSVVFLYAGISKIADRHFLDASSPISIHSQIVAVRDISPVSGLLGPVVDHSFAFGVFTSLAEIAIGLGVLLGLFTRIAALGGMILSLSLWLTISWGAEPWFTSADVVYLFAWTPTQNTAESFGTGGSTAPTSGGGLVLNFRSCSEVFSLSILSRR